jgi:hypothetical protein
MPDSYLDKGTGDFFADIKVFKAVDIEASGGISSCCYIFINSISLRFLISYLAIRSVSSFYIASSSNLTPTACAAFSTAPGGRFNSPRKLSALIFMPLALANTIDFAIFSRSVLFPPLCLILI